MKKLFKFMTKIITLATLLAMMTPVLYFGWRMGQPLDQPQFNGLTYYQFTQWRKLAFEDMAVKYQTQHPDENVSSTMCEGLAKSLTVVVVVPQTGAYTLASLKGAKPSPSYPLPEDVTVINFMSKWWATFEVIEWYNVNHYKYGPSLYCRIQPNIPTPAEFEALNHKHLAYKSASVSVLP